MDLQIHALSLYLHEHDQQVHTTALQEYYMHIPSRPGGLDMVTHDINYILNIAFHDYAPARQCQSRIS